MTKIIKISILKRTRSTDIVWLYFDIPDPFYNKEGFATRFETPKGTAEDYVKSHFGIDIPIKIIESNHG